MVPPCYMRTMKFENIKKILTDIEVLEGKSDDLNITGISDLDNLFENGLLFIKNKKFLAQVLDSELPRMNFLVGTKLKDSVSELTTKSPLTICSVENIDLAVSLLSKPFYLEKMKKPHFKSCVSPSAIIHEGAFVGKNTSIGGNTIIHPGAVVMDNCSVGEGCELFPNSILYPFVELEDDVRIHSGSVIGADGFGYNFSGGVHHKVWHMGGVKISSHVEIGANSQIDGGTFSPTLIGEGSKLDNNVQIGHNCKLGTGVMICGHVAIGGSSRIGDFTVFGGKSGMGDNMELGPGCQVAGGSLVNCDWPAKTTLGGHPARPLKEWMRGIAFVRKESLRK
jgi:UDP-3-O-[3-hydroxymyristoyl] glucosamine N-acyltransferase